LFALVDEQRRDQLSTLLDKLFGDQSDVFPPDRKED
jgi:hypothetical protein